MSLPEDTDTTPKSRYALAADDDSEETIMAVVTRRGMLQTVGAVGLGGMLATDTLGADHASSDHLPPFKLGTVTYMVAAKMDVPTLIDVCKKTKVEGVELRTTHAHAVEPSLSSDQRKEVRKRFEDSGVTLWGLGSVCEFHAPDKSVVEKNIETCKQFLQLAHDVGAHGVKVRPNGLPDGISPEKTIEQIGESLAMCGKAAESMGVEIWLEVHGKKTQYADVCKKIMEVANHKSVGLTWNSNPEDVKNGSIAESFAMLKPWIKSCHINDLWRDSQGLYPYRELFRLLRESGYDRFTLCEIPRTPVDVAAAEDFYRYYRALWTELARG
jgi:sugar phosphate isomerase/epimerase